MYYHNLNVIRKGSKKLLMIKKAKKKHLTPIQGGPERIQRL